MFGTPLFSIPASSSGSVVPHNENSSPDDMLSAGSAVGLSESSSLVIPFDSEIQQQQRGESGSLLRSLIPPVGSSSSFTENANTAVSNLGSSLSPGTHRDGSSRPESILSNNGVSSPLITTKPTASSQFHASPSTTEAKESMQSPNTERRKLQFHNLKGLDLSLQDPNRSLSASLDFSASSSRNSNEWRPSKTITPNLFHRVNQEDQRTIHQLTKKCEGMQHTIIDLNQYVEQLLSERATLTDYITQLEGFIHGFYESAEQEQLLKQQSSATVKKTKKSLSNGSNAKSPSRRPLRKKKNGNNGRSSTPSKSPANSPSAKNAAAQNKRQSSPSPTHQKIISKRKNRKRKASPAKKGNSNNGGFAKSPSPLRSPIATIQSPTRKSPSNKTPHRRHIRPKSATPSKSSRRSSLRHKAPNDPLSFQYQSTVEYDLIIGATLKNSNHHHLGLNASHTPPPRAQIKRPASAFSSSATAARKRSQALSHQNSAPHHLQSVQTQSDQNSFQIEFSPLIDSDTNGGHSLNHPYQVEGNWAEGNQSSRQANVELSPSEGIFSNHHSTEAASRDATPSLRLNGFRSKNSTHRLPSPKSSPRLPRSPPRNMMNWSPNSEEFPPNHSDGAQTLQSEEPKKRTKRAPHLQIPVNNSSLPWINETELNGGHAPEVEHMRPNSSKNVNEAMVGNME